MNISGNTIFIPGATSGIGLALAERLQAAGNVVIIGGRRIDLLAELASEHGFGTVAIDVADPTSIATATADVVTRYPDLNVLFAMAGIMRPEVWTTPAFLPDAEETVITNVLGPIRLIAALTEHLQTRPGATIITVSSGLAHAPLRVTPTYNATKAAIHQLSETVRMQLEPVGIQVIELVPPAVRTDLMPGHRESASAMPLDDYADEVMSLLDKDPDAHEILVEMSSSCVSVRCAATTTRWLPRSTPAIRTFVPEHNRTDHADGQLDEPELAGADAGLEAGLRTQGVHQFGDPSPIGAYAEA